MGGSAVRGRVRPIKLDAVAPRSRGGVRLRGAPAIMEALEPLYYLTSTYSPPGAGVSIVYLTPTATAGQVDVRLNSADAMPVVTLSPSAKSQDETLVLGVNNLTIIDRVPAAFKPVGGIKSTGHVSGTTFIVEAGDDDR